MKPQEERSLTASSMVASSTSVMCQRFIARSVRRTARDRRAAVQFYSPRERLFFLSANQPKDKALATAATDFGHNAKALWMFRWAGRITGQAGLVAFAEDNARALFARAYIDDCACWADGMLRGATLDVNKSWWIYAELDQLAGTLVQRDPTFAQALPRTYGYWFRHFVDPLHGEVWNGIDGRTHAPVRQLPKQWPWKNSYYTFEHALVGYIVRQQQYGEPVTLHYAWSGDPPAGPCDRITFPAR
jgi:hypothetical protein